MSLIGEQVVNGNCQSRRDVLEAGAGIRGGSVYGTSDRDAAFAIQDPRKPEDLAATIYDALGRDHELVLKDSQGRPSTIVRGGTPICELFA